MVRIKKELSKNLEKETGKRRARLSKELEAQKNFKLTLFQNEINYTGIIMMDDIDAVALCEHHHLEFTCKVSVGYIPGEWLMGASKLNRIVHKYLNPSVYTLQERATQQILDEIMKLRPQGAMVVVKGKHGCIKYRGVKDNSTMITSLVAGAFATNDGARNEFLALTNK